MDEKYECSHIDCKKTFKSSLLLRKHVKRSHGPKEYSCTASGCSKAFTTVHKLKVHLIYHKPFFEFMCSTCGNQFKRQDKLKEHMLRMHSASRTELNTCNSKLSMRSKRYKSVKLSEEELSKYFYRCNICMVGFKRRGILVNHLTKHHSQTSLDCVEELTQPITRSQIAFHCHYCDKVYKSNGKRKTHILNHHPTANMTFSSRLMETKVLGTEEVAIHPCKICSRQFLSNSKLLHHLRKFHNSETRNIS